MKIFEIESPKLYNNWVRYNEQSLNDDFEEYKLKEMSKWKARASRIGARFPLFPDIESFKQGLDSAKVVEIDALPDVQNLTKNNSIEDIEDMVSSYHMPRNVNRIVAGITNNAKLPLPIILKGSRGLWIMAGNTRQATTRVLGAVPKALLVDVSS
jgi:hypothetical protein